MAMTVQNNSTTQLILGELNKNNDKMSKSIKKVSSGMKLNGATDAASEYSISEKMRVQIRGLEQDNRNAQNGISLLKVAEGGMQNIVDELRSLKELALNAANDHNSDIDRAIIQRDLIKKRENIEDIAVNTTYNGKILLDDRYDTVYKKTPLTTEGLLGVDYLEALDNHKALRDSIINSSDLPITGTPPVTAPSYNATYSVMADGLHITTDGVVDLSLVSGYSGGQIYVEANNVKIIGDGTWNDGGITVTGSGSSLWIENLVLYQTNNNISAIKFNGSGNKLLLLGKNELDVSTTMSDNSNPQPAINVGDELTIYNGSTSSEGTLKIDLSNSLTSYRAGIGSYDNENASVTIESGTVGISTVYGAAIGSSAGGKFGNITINGGHIIADVAAGAAAIGSGAVGNALIDGKTMAMGDIVIGENAIIDAMSTYGAGIGTGMYYNSANLDGEYLTLAGNIDISGENIRAYSILADAIGHGMGGGGTLSSTEDEYGFFRFSVETFGESIINSISVTGGAYYFPYDQEHRYHLFQGDTFTLDGNNQKEYIDNKLLIQTGTKANMNVRILLKNMEPKALGIDDIEVNPLEKAIKALSKIDAAIDYSLDGITTVGAYQTRLRITIDNLTVASENMQASESVIRDADMAREMTDYTKNRVLSQSAQAMLAQANQRSASVLELLQG